MQFKECVEAIDRISPENFDVSDILDNIKTLQRDAKQLPDRRVSV